MFEFVTIGDLHLDKPRLHDIVNDCLTKQINTVEYILQYANKNKIKNAVYLGDLFDSHIASNEAFIALFNLWYKYKNITHHIYLGNHDIKCKDTNSLAFAKHLVTLFDVSHIKIYDEPTLVGNVEFHPYPSYKPIKKNTLCFGHIERPLSTRDNGSKMSSEEGHPEIGNNKWIMGHLHTPHEIGNTVYSGTPYQTSFGEQENKRFLHGIFDKKLKVKSIDIPEDKRFILRTVNATSLKDLKLDKNPNIYYRILYRGFEVPPKFLMEYPNVVDLKEYKDKKQLKELLNVEEVAYSLTDGLEDYLKGRGLDDHQIKRSIKLVNKHIKGA